MVLLWFFADVRLLSCLFWQFMDVLYLFCSYASSLVCTPPGSFYHLKPRRGSPRLYFRADLQQPCHLVVVRNRQVMQPVWCPVDQSMMIRSAVCFSAPHTQSSQGARLQLCTDEQKHPTLVQRWLSLTHASLSRCIPIGEEPCLG